MAGGGSSRSNPERDSRTLWMGDLDTYMDANFVGEAFLKMGEDVKNVKVIFDKYTGQFARYCFVELADPEAARRCMLQLNGKVIPESKPPMCFKLSFAFNPANPTTEFHILASNLANEVDDAKLYSLFGKRYYSCRGARVFRNPDQTSKGTGVIRFSNEEERDDALDELNRWILLGRPITLRPTQPRPRYNTQTNPRGPSGSYDPATYYPAHGDFYNSNQWQMYDYGSMPLPAAAPIGRPVMVPAGVPRGFPVTAQPDASTSFYNVPEELQLEDYEADFEVDSTNERFIRECEDNFRQLEASNWFFINSASFHESQLLPSLVYTENVPVKLEPAA